MTDAERILHLEAEAAAYRESIFNLYNMAALLKFEPDEAHPHPLKDGMYDKIMLAANQLLNDPSTRSDSIKRVLQAVKKWCERDEVYGSKISISLAKDDLDAAWEAYLSPSPEKSVYND